MKFPFTNPDVGKLILRVGLGVMFIVVHGWPKIAGGPERWTRVGAAMGSVGIDVTPMVWGLAASLTEIAGGLMLIAGLYTRAAALSLAAVMAVAAARNIWADGFFWCGPSHRSGSGTDRIDAHRRREVQHRRKLVVTIPGGTSAMPERTNAKYEYRKLKFRFSESRS